MILQDFDMDYIYKIKEVNKIWAGISVCTKINLNDNGDAFEVCFKDLMIDYDTQNVCVDDEWNITDTDNLEFEKIGHKDVYPEYFL